MTCNHLYGEWRQPCCDQSLWRISEDQDVTVCLPSTLTLYRAPPRLSSVLSVLSVLHRFTQTLCCPSWDLSCLPRLSLPHHQMFQIWIYIHSRSPGLVLVLLCLCLSPWVCLLCLRGGRRSCGSGTICSTAPGGFSSSSKITLSLSVQLLLLLMWWS